MFKTRRLNETPPIPYCVKYGPRSGLRTTKNETSVVDFSFLRPREGLNLNEVHKIDPEWVDEALKLISNGVD